MYRTQRPLSLDELRDVLAPLGTPVGARPLSGGMFGSVQAVDLADGRSVVVKTSAPDAADALLTYEHDLARVEADMLTLLAPVESIPTAALVLEDFSRSRVEVDVLVSEYMDGTPWDRAPAMTADAVATAGRNVGAIFARLHEITSPRFGYPAGDFRLGGDTWPDVFTAILTAHIADAVRFGVDVRADELLDVLSRGRGALAEVDTARLLHHDLWPGNVLLDPASGLVMGVVDLERMLYGDPLMDFVGMDPFGDGDLPADHVAGYLAAGGTLARGDAADARLTLYRLNVLTLMLVEAIPRGYHGDWLDGHLELTRRRRDAALAHAQATFPAA